MSRFRVTKLNLYGNPADEYAYGDKSEVDKLGTLIFWKGNTMVQAYAANAWLEVERLRD